MGENKFKLNDYIISCVFILISLLLITLKVTGVVDWSWWIILSPVILWLVVGLVLMLQPIINKNGLDYYLKPELHHEFKEFIIEEEND